MNIGIETETQEFKKSTSELRSGIESLCAMLNKHGHGILYFGVRDNGDIIGQEIGRGTLRDISLEIANHLKPQAIPTITHQMIDDRDIIKVEIRGHETPYSAYDKYYMRSADEDRMLSPGALKELMLKNETTDVITLLDSPLQNLEFSQLKSAFRLKGLTVNEDTFEDNSGLRNAGGKYNLMAYLLSDKNDISLKVVTFQGKDKTMMVLRNEYGGKSLITAMEQVLSYVEALNATRVIIGTRRREEIPLFDFASFKEAWQNACLHNRWDMDNPPCVYVFSDRIEVISTGGLPSDLEPAEFFKGISKPVNPKLQKIFGQLGLVEQTGHGIPLITTRYGEQAFDIMPHFINVVIPFSEELSDAKHNQVNYGQELPPVYSKILECMERQHNITYYQIAAETGFSEIYIRKAAKKMMEQNLIRRVGSRKNGFWEIIAEN